MRAFPWAYRPVVPALWVFGPVLFKDIVKAARSSIHLASSPDLEGVTGKYFDTNATESTWPDSVLDESNRSAVWDLCTRMVTAA